jgi:hypothetical protein
MAPRRGDFGQKGLGRQLKFYSGLAEVREACEVAPNFEPIERVRQRSG